jgi:quinol monooxygenase YgiN
LPFHFIVSFDPQPKDTPVFREELFRVIEPSRQEPGCIRMDVFESVCQPSVFSIHSEWIDEAAFDLHGTLPHTLRFLSAVEKLIGRPAKGLRLRQIGGGVGAAKA